MRYLIHVTAYSAQCSQHLIRYLSVNIHDLTVQRHVLYICSGFHMALVGSLFYFFPFTKREREMFVLPVFYLNIIDLLVVCITVVRF